MKSIEFLPGARKDYDQAFDWYLARSEESARRFAMAVQAVCDRISQAPEQLPRVGRTHRECSLSRYPFRIIFRVYDDKIVIVAVAHAKRRPNYWRRRK